MEEAFTEDEVRALLRRMIKEQGISQAEMARRIGILPSTLSEQLTQNHPEPLGKKTLAYLGYERTWLFRKVRKKK